MIPFPNKKYSVIYADPPWAYRNTATRAAASGHYPTMRCKELMEMRKVVGGVAADNCVLLMWATFPTIKDALALIGEV